MASPLNRVAMRELRAALADAVDLDVCSHAHADAVWLSVVEGADTAQRAAGVWLEAVSQARATRPAPVRTRRTPSPRLQQRRRVVATTSPGSLRSPGQRRMQVDRAEIYMYAMNGAQAEARTSSPRAADMDVASMASAAVNMATLLQPVACSVSQTAHQTARLHLEGVRQVYACVRLGVRGRTAQSSFAHWPARGAGCVSQMALAPALMGSHQPTAQCRSARPTALGTARAQIPLLPPPPPPCPPHAPRAFVMTVGLVNSASCPHAR